jgi:hypothetical protein
MGSSWVVAIVANPKFVGKLTQCAKLKHRIAHFSRDQQRLFGQGCCADIFKLGAKNIGHPNQ